MTFPVIHHINQVLPALAGRDEFVVARKDGYTVIDYRYELLDSFDDPIRRECRGLKFAPDGVLLARPLHKFWNYGQKPETSWEGGVLNLSDPHVVMEKLDGSMIHPAMVVVDGFTFGGVRLMTRMGVTDVSKAAEDHFMSAELADALADCLDYGFTPIFEYVGPDNRIVEAYEEPELILLQVRDTTSGDYLDLRGLKHWADRFGVKTAPVYPAFTRHEDLLSIYDRVEGEGVVMKFDKGLFVKIKTEEYRRLHRLRDNVSREHDLTLVVLDGSIDDAMPLFDAKTQAEVIAFADKVNRGASRAAFEINDLVYSSHHLDQKTFATVTLADKSPMIRSCAFTLRKQVEAGETPITAALTIVHQAIRKNCVNAQRFELIRDSLCGGAHLTKPVYMGDQEAA